MKLVGPPVQAGGPLGARQPRNFGARGGGPPEVLGAGPAATGGFSARARLVATDLQWQASPDC